MLRASAWIGSAVALLGASVLVGWSVQSAVLTSVLPGVDSTKPDTAVALILLGAALCLRSREGLVTRALVRVAAVLVGVLALVTLTEYASGWNFRIDELVIRDLATPPALHPGRMALATAIALLLAAGVLALLEVAGRWPRLGGLARALSAVVVAIGVLGLLGYAFDVAFLYTWYAPGAIGLPTAGALALLGMALLAAGQATAAPSMSEDQRITRTAALALIMVAGATGIAGMAALESQLERGIFSEMRRVLAAHLGELTTNLELRQTRAEIVTTRPSMLRYLRILADEPARQAEARAVVQGVLESFLLHDFSQLAVIGPTGEQVARAGTALPAPTLEMPIGHEGAVRLVWRGSLALHHELALSDPQGSLGTLVAEQRLPRATQLLQSNQTGFPSGEFLLCRPVGPRFQCFPSRLSAGAIVVPPATTGPRRLPERALAEGTGVAAAVDYRGHRVMGAYHYLPSFGLVAILKVDVDDIYAPIRRQVGSALLLVALVIVGGVALVRLRVRPLATQLEKRVQARTADLLQTTQTLEHEVGDRTRAEQALHESEERYRLVVEHVHDALLLVDLEGRFTFGNRRLEELTGYRLDELIGQSVTMVLTPEDAGASVTRGEILRAGHAGPFAYETEVVRKDGSRIWVEVNSTSILRDGKIMARLGVVRDITHRKEAEAVLRESAAALTKSAERLGVLHEIDQAIIAAREPKAIAEAALRRLRPLLGDARAAVALFDFAAGEGQWLAVDGSGSVIAPGRRFPLPPGEELEAFRRGEMQDVDPTLASGVFADAPMAAGIRFLLRMPLRAGGELFGILTVGAKNREAFPADQLQIAREVADQVAIALAQARLRAEILERQRQTEASEARFRALVEGSIQGIYLADRDYRIRYANAAVARIYGYESPEILIGRSTLEFYPPEEQARLLGYARARALGEPAPTRYEVQALRRDGSRIWLEVLVSMVVQHGERLFQTTLIDISERHAAADALRRSEARARALLEASSEGIVIIDRHGRIQSVNDKVEAMFGYSSAELVGQSLEMLLPERFRAGHVGHRSQFFSAPQARVMGKGRDLVARRRDGTEFPVEVGLNYIETDAGIQAVAFVADITERRQIAAALHERDEQLRQAQKLETIGQLAGGVAHDLNNLLSVVIGRGQLLLDRLPAAGPERRALNMMVSSAQRGAGVVKQLLTFSRRQPVELRLLNLNQVVADIVPMLRRLIGEQIALDVRAAEGLGRVRADKGQVDQVIMNLVINARDAMPDGGRVIIETDNVDLGEDYARQHVGASAGPHVMLAVTDTGAGMDAATKARIFEPFFTTKELGKGTGLGLATVYGIVRQSAGSIWAYSEPGEGTSLKIYLPRVGAVADVAAAAPARPQHGTETILIAEDEEDVRELVRELLQVFGYTVLEATRPADALLIAERHAGPIHLLLTDVIMPEITGPQLADRLAPLRPEMRTLYMSGYPGEAIVQQGRLAPGTFYLQKPFTPDRLRVKVREVLDAPE